MKKPPPRLIHKPIVGWEDIHESTDRMATLKCGHKVRVRFDKLYVRRRRGMGISLVATSGCPYCKRKPEKGKIK